MRPRESISLILIATASLAYEICLTRVFAVQQFYSFAFLVVSLAVMGFAASGVALTLIRNQPSRRFLAAGFSLTAILAYAVINYVPFDSFRIAWDRTQIWILLFYFTAAGVPFLCGGWFIGSALRQAGESAFRPYAANLLGSAMGCLVALASLQWVSEEGALGIAIALGFISAALLEERIFQRSIVLILATASLIFFLQPLAPVRLKLSPYKPLSVAMQFPGAKVMATQRNASARGEVLASGGIHSYPGLSLTSPVPPYRQLGLFIDGEGPYPITNIAARGQEGAAFYQHMPAAIAYTLRPGSQALVVNPGTGMAAQGALVMGASQVSIPTDQPLIALLLDQDLSEASANFLRDQRLDRYPFSSRSMLSMRDNEYTVVEWALSDPYRPIASGAFSLVENFILTQEAFEAGWKRLTSDGILVITRWIGTPPSEATRAWSTLLQALRSQGLARPADHLAAFRGMRTMTILASKQPFSGEELSMIRAFLTKNAFDPVYLPDLAEKEVNQFNRLPQPIYQRLFSALVSKPQITMGEYDFRLEPATDDQPYFFHFFRWAQSSQVLATLGVIWQPFGGSGYFVLLAMLALMFMLSTPLVLLPWLATRRDRQASPPQRRAWFYFGALGAGFMLVEIPLIQRLNLMLDFPVLAFGLVLFILLLSSGFGSLLSEQIRLRRALLALIVLLSTHIGLLPIVIQESLAQPLMIRVLIVTLWLVPTGICMGIPFAAGLRLLEQRTPGFIPWAWAINGAVSGIAGVLASLALLDLGFQMTLVLGGVCYTGALYAAGVWADSSLV